MAVDGNIGKNVMRNTKNIKNGARIVSIKPKRYGSKGASHYEAIINFSDGSWYRTNCGEENHHLTYVSFRFDRSQLPDVINQAIEAHERCAHKNERRRSKRRGKDN